MGTHEISTHVAALTNFHVLRVFVCWRQDPVNKSDFFLACDQQLWIIICRLYVIDS